MICYNIAEKKNSSLNLRIRPFFCGFRIIMKPGEIRRYIGKGAPFPKDPAAKSEGDDTYGSNCE